MVNNGTDKQVDVTTPEGKAKNRRVVVVLGTAS